MAQVLDRPSQIYLCRGSEEFVFRSGSLVLGSEIERCLIPRTTEPLVRALLEGHHCEGRDL